MKQILISIRPEWVAKILNREKIIEVRKSAPKELPCEVYIYCTKGLSLNKGLSRYIASKTRFPNDMNGKVVAKFTLSKVESLEELIGQEGWYGGYYPYLGTESLDQNTLCRAACLSEDEIKNYVDYLSKKKIYGYAWHISDLEIFNDPKDLEKFDYPNPSGIVNVSQSSIKGLPNKKHPPQSWCYVEESL